MNHRNPKINKGASQIIEEIRSELKKIQQCEPKTDNQDRSFAHESSNIEHNPRLQLKSLNDDTSLQLEDKARYHIKDFLSYSDEIDFIDKAFLAILKRHADPNGQKLFLDRMKRGMSRIEILGWLRFSPEGRKQKVHIDGLVLRLFLHLLYRIPLIGYIFAVGVSILTLPKRQNEVKSTHNKLNKTLQSMQRDLNYNFSNIGDRYEGLVAETKIIVTRLHDNTLLFEKIQNLHQDADLHIKTLHEQSSQLRDEVKMLGHGMNKQNTMLDHFQVRHDSLESQTSSLRSEMEKILQHITQTEQKRDTLIKTLQDLEKSSARMKNIVDGFKNKNENDRKKIDDLRLQVLDQQRKFSALFYTFNKNFENMRSFPVAHTIHEEEDHLYDDLYFDLEQLLRGSEERISQLLRNYIPYVKESAAANPDFVVLDLGCGRGEWLKLCREEGLSAIGVDNNRLMVKKCLNDNVHVIESDAHEYLRSLAEDSIGAITGFHIIEHFPFKKQISLIDEVYRVLVPGGIAIFETPNPENLTVGAFSFYLDPTHSTPIVPLTLKTMFELRGFVEVHIERLHKNLQYFEEKPDSEFKNKWFYSEMDYAVIGKKS